MPPLPALSVTLSPWQKVVGPPAVSEASFCVTSAVAPPVQPLSPVTVTLYEPAEMDELLELGVDGIMTDRPAILKDVLVQRSAWVT